MLSEISTRHSAGWCSSLMGSAGALHYWSSILSEAFMDVQNNVQMFAQRLGALLAFHAQYLWRIRASHCT